VDGLFYLPAQAQQFRRHPGNSLKLGQTRDGVLWAAGDHDVLQPLFNPSESSMTPLRASQLLIDRDGGMWILTSAHGIARIAHPAGRSKGLAATPNPIQEFTQRDGLSDNRITDALEDREGNIWVATRGGLDRFRRRNVVPGPFPYGNEGQDLALVTDPEGGIWAGNLDQPLTRFQNGILSFQSENISVSCAYRGPDGTLWFGGPNHLARLSNQRLETVSLPSEINPRLGWPVQALTADPNGGLWASITQNGVFRLWDGKWTRWGGVRDLPKRTPVTLWTDHRGRVWFGYTENEVALLGAAGVRTFSSPQGLNVGTVTAIGGGNRHIWIGGEFGLALFDETHLRMIRAPADGKFRSISGIIEMPNGDLWLNEAGGLMHIAGREIERALIDPRYSVRFENFDFRDGVLGTASPIRPLPSAVLAHDGRIWVSGANGAAWIDPQHIHRNPVPPPVSVESIFVDGRAYDPAAPAQLPILLSNLRIQYTALSLSIPERVHFRYRLDGYDEDWQDAGTRREASYTKLGPGRYRFRVIACNNDGVWNMQGAAVDLIVPPAFFQTAWFVALCALAAASLLWMLYHLRIRHVALDIQRRLEDRLAERELHDTLLQGVQGLILRFQAVAKRLSPADPARHSMEEALDRADEVMVEERNRVRRNHSGAPFALPQAFSAVGEELSRDYPGTVFRVVVEGNPGELHPVVGDEAYRVGREAISNAFCHAQAREIEVEIAYEGTGLQVRVRDDGRGIDPNVLGLGSRPSHWGLTGMRERAQKVGGYLEISSRLGAGTEVELRIPDALAFPTKHKKFFPWPRKRLERKGIR
jgi:signal transduction histidine kinase/ligand-binding sensor domain-containing protein